MKKIGILLASFLLLAVGAQPQKVVVAGVFDRPTDKEKLSLFLNQIGVWRGILATGEVVADKSFRLEAEVPAAGFYKFRLVDETYDIYLAPGDELHYRVDGSGIRVSGEGHVAENQLLVDALPYQQAYARLPRAVRTSFGEERAGAAWKMYSNKLAALENAPVSDAFADAYRGYIAVEYWRSLVGGVNNRQGTVLTPAYRKMLERVPLSAAMLNHGEWGNLLAEWVNYQLRVGDIKWKGYGRWLKDMTSCIKDKELREAYLVRQIGSEVLRGELLGLEENIRSVEKLIHHPENKQKVADYLVQIGKDYARYAACLPGSDLSAFEFKDRDGETVKLGDLKGKYVFIDIWSTGCIPCKQEIPHLARLEAAMEKEDLLFVSISLDKKEEVWQKFIAEKSLGGLQLITTQGFRHPICKALGMSGIPRFVILDRECRVINFNTKRPSNPILWNYLQDIVKH